MLKNVCFAIKTSFLILNRILDTIQKTYDE